MFGHWPMRIKRGGTIVQGLRQDCELLRPWMGSADARRRLVAPVTDDGQRRCFVTTLGDRIVACRKKWRGSRDGFSPLAAHGAAADGGGRDAREEEREQNRAADA